ncbi:MAG: O-antigen ligase family protein [Acidobacteriota bacterium]
MKPQDLDTHRHRASARRPRVAAPRTGFWLYAGHLLAIWGLAVSNLFHGLLIVWSAIESRSLRRVARRLRADAYDARLLAAVFVPATLAVALFTLSCLTSLEPTVSLPELRDVVSWLTLFLAPLVVRGEAAVRRLVDLLLGLVVLLAVHGIVQYYLTDYGPLHRRIVGLFSHYQTFAGVLLIGALLFAARLASPRRDAWTWAGFGIVLWCLVLTLTRGAWVGAAVTLLGFVLLRLVRRERPLAAVGTVTVAIALALVAGLIAPGSWQERLTSIHDLRDVSNYDRLCMAEAALFMISERPLVGVGPEVVPTRYAIYRHPTAPRLEVPHLHNTYLQRAAELGLPSLAAHLWLLGAIAWAARRRYLDEGGADGARADLLLGTLLVVCGFAIAGFFEDNWRDTEIRRLALFVFAIPLCLRHAAPRRSSPEA